MKILFEDLLMMENWFEACWNDGSKKIKHNLPNYRSAYTLFSSSFYQILIWCEVVITSITPTITTAIHGQHRWPRVDPTWHPPSSAHSKSGGKVLIAVSKVQSTQLPSSHRQPIENTCGTPNRTIYRKLTRVMGDPVMESIRGGLARVSSQVTRSWILDCSHS